jgi:hypothetical protein
LSQRREQQKKTWCVPWNCCFKISRTSIRLWTLLFLKLPFSGIEPCDLFDSRLPVERLWRVDRVQRRLRRWHPAPAPDGGHPRGQRRTALPRSWHRVPQLQRRPMLKWVPRTVLKANLCSRAFKARLTYICTLGRLETFFKTFFTPYKLWVTISPSQSIKRFHVTYIHVLIIAMLKIVQIVCTEL